MLCLQGRRTLAVFVLDRRHPVPYHEICQRSRTWCCVLGSEEDPCSCSFSNARGHIGCFHRRWWTPGPGLDDSVSLTEIGQNFDTSDWVGWQCVYKSAEGFVLSYVNPTLDLLWTRRRNQTICGFRRNSDVGDAALSCYAALRQHGISESLRSLPIWRWVTVPVQYNGMTTRSVVMSAWGLLEFSLEPYCTSMLSGCNRHKRVRLSTLVDRTL